MSSQARWYVKANAYAEAWRDIFGSYPPRCAVVLGLAVAEHETRCGDDWPGENNWGAVQLRSLNVAERAVLAGITPSPKTVAAARDALDDGGLEEPLGALHADWSPRKHEYYFVWFARFDTEAAGAKHCVDVLAKRRPTCCIVLRDPYGTERALAERMYATRYFEGFQDPNKFYGGRPGHWVECPKDAPNAVPGSEADIQDYTYALAQLTPGIRDALKSWTPGDPAPDLDDLSTTLGIQRALNKIGSDPTLKEDGVMGPKTRASIMFFQKASALTADGIVGPATRAALRSALT